MLQQQRIADWEAELKEMPEGYLKIDRKKGKAYYSHSIDNRTIGITLNEALIYTLARKQYLKLRILEGKRSLQNASRSVRGKRIPDRYRMKGDGGLRSLVKKFSEVGLDVMRITCSKKQYEWMSDDYERNTSEWSGAEYISYSGRKFRSKSERDIANELEIRGIPYRYEPKIKVRVHWMKGVEYTIEGKYKVYCPDFVILTATDTYIIWEHLGRVDLLEYRMHNMEKIAVYRQGGYCTDETLILTFEKDLENLETIGTLIERRIIPYV